MCLAAFAEVVDTNVGNVGVAPLSSVVIISLLVSSGCSGPRGPPRGSHINSLSRCPVTSIGFGYTCEAGTPFWGGAGIGDEPHRRCEFQHRL